MRLPTRSGCHVPYISPGGKRFHFAKTVHEKQMEDSKNQGPECIEYSGP